MTGWEGGGLAGDLATTLTVACPVAVAWLGRHRLRQTARWVAAVTRPLPHGWRADARTARAMKAARR